MAVLIMIFKFVLCINSSGEYGGEFIRNIAAAFQSFVHAKIKISASLTQRIHFFVRQRIHDSQWWRIDNLLLGILFTGEDSPIFG